MLTQAWNKYLYRGGRFAIWVQYEWHLFMVGVEFDGMSDMKTLKLGLGPLQIDFDFGNV